MLYNSTLSEIATNINTGVEYEIALFYALLKNNPQEQKQIMSAINKRYDVSKVKEIIVQTTTSPIERELKNKGWALVDVSFETQNDEVGPADIIMYVKNQNGRQKKIGISVKYANTCTLNVTGKNFITEKQITHLRKLLPHYTDMYINEMKSTYGNVNNWFHKKKPSSTTDKYIDLIRDAIIENWKNLRNKTSLLRTLFHADSPIEFWVATYGKYGYLLKTKPQTIDMSRANDVIIEKYQTSYVAFYLDGTKVGHMQVKFNNGFVERCKKMNPDVTCDGVPMSYGKPFSSWNFSVEQ